MPLISAVAEHAVFRLSRYLHRSRAVAFTCAMLMLPVPSDPADVPLQVSSMIVELGANDLMPSDVKINSTASNPVAVQIFPTRVIAPGQEHEAVIALNDLDQPGLQISPRRFVLQQGVEQTLRFVALGAAGDQDRVYRVLVKPDAPANGPETDALVAYNLLVLVRPANPVVELEAARDSDELVLRNTGNTNALIQDGYQCLNEDQCLKLPSRRIYAGAQTRVHLPYAMAPANYLLVGPDGSRHLKFPAAGPTPRED